MRRCSEDGIQAPFKDLGRILAIHTQGQRHYWSSRDWIRQDCSFRDSCDTEAAGQPSAILRSCHVSHSRALRLDFRAVWGYWVIDRTQNCCLGGRSWHGVSSHCPVEEASHHSWYPWQSCRPSRQHQRFPLEEAKIPHLWRSWQTAEHGLREADQLDSDIDP